ncbi:hypothetical protein RUND412_009168 [Rhizina undulata]
MSDHSDPPKYLSITGQPLAGLDSREILLGAYIRHLSHQQELTSPGRCRDIEEFEQLNQLGEGTYGVVHRAHDTKNAKIVALKQVRIFDHDRGNGIPITALREISILKSLRHNNVVNVLDVAVGKELNDVYMVMEYAEQDLANLLDHAKVQYSESEVKCLMKQLLEGLDYLHRHDIIHRDIKMSNLLLTSRGILKIADFGMARKFSHRPLTPGVVTVWYRSPELLLSATRYTPSVDIWSAGCILGELLLLAPLLPGDTEMEQFSLIVKLLGSPSDRIWPKMKLLPGIPSGSRGGYVPPPVGAQRENMLERRFKDKSKETVKLLNDMLTFDPERRITAPEALKHRYFSESPRAVRPEMMQTWPEIRNRETSRKRAGGEEGGYVFDFGEVGEGRKRIRGN